LKEKITKPERKEQMMNASKRNHEVGSGEGKGAQISLLLICVIHVGSGAELQVKEGLSVQKTEEAEYKGGEEIAKVRERGNLMTRRQESQGGRRKKVFRELREQLNEFF